MSISRQNLTVIIVSFISDKVIHNCISSIPRDIKIIIVDNSNNKSFKNTIFCENCLNYISDTINPFLKGWISRNQTRKKVKFNILSNSLSPFINGFITRKNIYNITNKIPSAKLYLTPDKGITKNILQKGDRTFPTKGQLVTVHYIGTLSNGTEFDSSYKRIYPFEFILGQNNVIPLWDIGIKTMSKGEKSILIGTSDYCYQNQELPNIPAGSTLHFAPGEALPVELIRKIISERMMQNEILALSKKSKK